MGWLGIVYLGSLVVRFVTAFWTLNDFTGLIVKGFSLDNFQLIFTEPVYRRIVLRTLSARRARDGHRHPARVPDRVLHGASSARPDEGPARRRGAHAAVGGYLVKVYSWRTMLSTNGVINWFLDPFGLRVPTSGYVRVWIVMAYLWLPYMILPLYAGLERIQDSLLDASGDLGARPWRTFRSVVLPLLCPRSSPARSSPSR